MTRRKNITITLVVILFVGMWCGIGEVRPEADDAKAHPYICVKGILFDNDVPLALVNHVVIGVGDTISGAKVVEISSASVKFEYEGEVFEQQVGVCGETMSSPYEKTAPRKATRAITNNKMAEGFLDAMSDGMPKMRLSDKEVTRFIGVTAGMMGVFILIILVLYVYNAIVFQTIARRTGTENGWLAWIPIANVYLMCQIAGKPGWWLLLFFVPFVNVIITIIVFIEIAKACNKPAWIGILLLLPGINLIVLGYLAFSKEARIVEEQTVQSQPKPPYQP